jgi:hypothetical protein
MRARRDREEDACPIRKLPRELAIDEHEQGTPNATPVRDTAENKARWVILVVEHGLLLSLPNAETYLLYISYPSSKPFTARNPNCAASSEDL